jgi:hypothetical protein
VKLSRQMQRLRAKLLRDSGFHDLEPVPGGKLSDRGNLHPVALTRQEDERLAHRMSSGAEYVAWAESVLHDGPRFRSTEQREAWRLHANGLSEMDIATALTITRDRVRVHLAATKERVSKVSKVKRWQNQRKQRTAHLRRLARDCDPQALTTLVALMVRQLARSLP